jgi:hypothetical protein
MVFVSLQFSSIIGDSTDDSTGFTASLGSYRSVKKRSLLITEKRTLPREVSDRCENVMI